MICERNLARLLTVLQSTHDISREIPVLTKLKPVLAAIALAVTVTGGATMVVSPADAHTTGIHDNCTKLRQKWPHGVGTRKAVDRTSGTKVTNFYRNNDAYWAAERHNPDLDRDNDRIACEKR